MLRSMSGWHVSEGIAKHRKRTGLGQKEVDILIAVDMLTHTHRKNMHRLTFVSGDQDFAPLIEAVVRDGMYVQLLFPEGHTAKDLMDFADDARPMDVDFMHSISTDAFKKRHVLPSRQFVHASATAMYGTWLADGLIDGEIVAKAWRDPVGFVFIHKQLPDRNDQKFMVRDDDEDLAKRYFAHRMKRDYGLGQLVWQPAM